MSFDAGQRTADYLASEFSIEQSCQDTPFPIGLTNVRRWLLELSEELGAKEVALEVVAEGEEAVVDYEAVPLPIFPRA